jgi:hypothetical protein
MSGWDDLAAMAGVAARDAFGTAVLYRPEGGDPVTITAIFHAEHGEAGLAGGVPVTTIAPVLDVWLADLAAEPEEGDTLTVAGGDYRVVDIRADGIGGAKLILHRVQP